LRWTDALTSPRKIAFSADTVTAIAAVFVAVVALGVSVWQVRESQNHDRLAVMPHLDFGTRMGSGFDYCGLVLRTRV